MDVLSLLAQVTSVLNTNAGDQFISNSPKFTLTLATLLSHPDSSVQTELLNCMILLTQKARTHRHYDKSIIDEVHKHCHRQQSLIHPSNQDLFHYFLHILQPTLEPPHPQKAPPPPPSPPSLLHLKEAASDHARTLSSSYVAKKGTDIMIFSLSSEDSSPLSSLSSSLQKRLVQIPQVISAVVQLSAHSPFLAALVVTVRNQNENERSNTVSVILDQLPSFVFGEFVHLQLGTVGCYLDEEGRGDKRKGEGQGEERRGEERRGEGRDGEKDVLNWSSVLKPAFYLTSSKVMKEAQMVRIECVQQEVEAAEKLRLEKQRRVDLMKEQRKKESKISSLLLNLRGRAMW